ncbi:hypothetical protein CF319_g5397 [Tilletia indica]|nr:hypothetical protein CF319_g5397 [Tilletia indica]
MTVEMGHLWRGFDISARHYDNPTSLQRDVSSHSFIRPCLQSCFFERPPPWIIELNLDPTDFRPSEGIFVAQRILETDVEEADSSRSTVFSSAGTSAQAPGE